MSQVKVWNRNRYDFKQTFKGDVISIPAGKYIILDEGTAQEFKSAYAPMRKLADGQADPRSYKMIELEKTDETTTPVAVTKAELLCNKCGHKAFSQADLDDHLLGMHYDELLDSKKAEQAVKEVRK